MDRCYDCQNYRNLTLTKTGGAVEFTREQFVAWKRAQNRVCYYCGISEGDFRALRIVNVRTAKPMESLGVDRIDNKAPYQLTNLVICCGGCNAIKSGILTADEMLLLGPCVAAVWHRRLARPLTLD